jgi:hypothetical protein
MDGGQLNTRSGGWSRRGVLAGLSTASLAACGTTPGGPAAPAPSPAPSTGEAAQTFPMRFPAVIDTASRTTGQVRALAGLGVRVIVRYYAEAAQPEVPDKQLTKEEADAILGAGLSLAVVYQYYSNQKANIHAARGLSDGQVSLERAATFNQPRGSAVYFGIDGDWPDKTADIRAYFEAVNGVLKPAGYRVGVYGSGATCAQVLDAGLADLAWLAYAPAWSGSARFYNSKRWALFQAGLDTRTAGLRIDTNLVNPAATDFGQWSRAGVGQGVDAAQGAAITEHRRFVARKAAKLLSAPDAGAAAIDTPRFRKGNVVRLVAAQGEWVQVDVNETGQATGWCRRGDLTADLSIRPDYSAPD